MRLIVAALLLTLAAPAVAHWDGPADQALHAWFDSLASGKGLCCSFADGLALKDIDWDTGGPNNAYRVRLLGTWVVVPAEAVVTVPNKYGAAVVWPVPDGEGHYWIRCFLPSAEAEMTIHVIDTDDPVSATQAVQLKTQGIDCVGRYLNRHNPTGTKVIKAAEARVFAAAGLRLFLIYEYDGKPSGAGQGAFDGEYCASYAPTIGAPTDGSAVIAYTVDWDAPESAMDEIKAAFQAFQRAVAPKFQVWAYASGAVCAELYAAKLITGRWLTCSGGFRGTKEALATGAYEMRQYLPREISGLDTDPDDTHIANMPVGFIPFAAPETAVARAEAWIASKL